MTTSKKRRIRLDKIAKSLKRDKIWGEDQASALLDNAETDLLLLLKK